ncbi:hypothetical protein EC988_004662, partial [Linderina pennispora]
AKDAQAASKDGQADAKDTKAEGKDSSQPAESQKAPASGNSDARDAVISINAANGGDSAKPSATTNGFGISLNNNNGNSATPSKSTSSSKASSSSSSSSSNGQPGRIVMKTPPRAVQSPLFEINSIVKLAWDYDDNMKKAPSKISIRGQMPSTITEPGTGKPLYWYIAQNVSGSEKAYDWNTVTQSPPGYTLSEGAGYKLFIYDSDIGWENSTRVSAGKLFQFTLPFAMYNSRYAQSNDGVTSNYNPNAATRAVSLTVGAWAVILGAVLTAVSF